MKESVYKSYGELPLFLNAKLVAQVLGISPSSGYELMHEQDFPVLIIGNPVFHQFPGIRPFITLIVRPSASQERHDERPSIPF